MAARQLEETAEKPGLTLAALIGLRAFAPSRDGDGAVVTAFFRGFCQLRSRLGFDFNVIRRHGANFAIDAGVDVSA